VNQQFVENPSPQSSLQTQVIFVLDAVEIPVRRSQAGGNHEDRRAGLFLDRVEIPIRRAQASPNENHGNEMYVDFLKNGCVDVNIFQAPPPIVRAPPSSPSGPTWGRGMFLSISEKKGIDANLPVACRELPSPSLTVLERLHV
jgi:hypothetical protein